MRIISERTVDIDEEFFTCFIDWQKVFDRVNCNTLMSIQETSVSTGAKKKGLIKKLCVDQNVNKLLYEEDRRSVKKLEEELDTGAVCRRFCWIYTTNTRKSLEGFVDFKLEGKVIRTLNYGDDLVLLAEEEAVP